MTNADRGGERRGDDREKIADSIRRTSLGMVQVIGGLIPLVRMIGVSYDLTAGMIEHAKKNLRRAVEEGGMPEVAVVLIAAVSLSEFWQDYVEESAERHARRDPEARKAIDRYRLEMLVRETFNERKPDDE